MIYYYEDCLAGVVYYYDIKPAQEAFWGFYLSNQLEDYEKLRLWYALEKEAISYAFEQLNVNTLKCEVFKDNKAVLFMHKKVGFKVINTYQHAKGEVTIMELKSAQEI